MNHEEMSPKCEVELTSKLPHSRFLRIRNNNGPSIGFEGPNLLIKEIQITFKDVQKPNLIVSLISFLSQVMNKIINMRSQNFHNTRVLFFVFTEKTEKLQERTF